jgi:hypothetical protein
MQFAPCLEVGILVSQRAEEGGPGRLEVVASQRQATTVFRVCLIVAAGGCEQALNFDQDFGLTGVEY